MSYSVMEALFDGRIVPWERRNANSPERKELLAKIERERRHFTELMSLEDRKRFSDFEDLHNGYAFEEEVDVYAHGFTLGALLMQEIMMKKESIVDPGS